MGALGEAFGCQGRVVGLIARLVQPSLGLCVSFFGVDAKCSQGAPIESASSLEATIDLRLLQRPNRFGVERSIRGSRLITLVAERPLHRANGGSAAYWDIPRAHTRRAH